ncbi:taste receptor type 2 member 40-like [Rana temporaria]|uniref:taste receptor type 2 member 40-like n=1 Tax=Rana temporaria TaxID=8407 RepID=UPI001AADCE79|nr:taste receptor type 2 member 40-like [Rana temporaria]
MISSTTVICLGVLAIEAIAGLCSDIFIITSLILSGYKEKYFAPYTSILIALCVSNVGYTILMFANNLISFVFPTIFSDPYITYFVNYMTVFSIISSSWLTSTLCFFYFIKIVQFKPGFLAWVKMKIETIVPWMILTVELFSLFGSFLALLVNNRESATNSTISMTEVTPKQLQLNLEFVILVIIVISLPISISISSMVFSSWFLKRHRDHIKRNLGESHGGLKEYQSAVQTMFCLIFFYALLYLVTLMLVVPIFDSQSWGYWMCDMVLFSFALVQSSLLIAGNPKLKEAWKQKFTCA